MREFGFGAVMVKGGESFVVGSRIRMNGWRFFDHSDHSLALIVIGEGFSIFICSKQTNKQHKEGYPHQQEEERRLLAKCSGRSLGNSFIMLTAAAAAAATNYDFPAFLPKQVAKVKDPFARKLASRIHRLPVQLGISDDCIMSSCVKPIIQNTTTNPPLVLLHGFDSSCLEWRYTLPLLEQAGFETWAIDILGWGFSDLEKLPQCNVESKRDHLFQFWKTYIGRPMLLVGPSLGAAVAIDFTINHPEAVDKLILIDASVYAEGTGSLSRLPKFVAYAGVSVLKSLPLRIFATNLTCNSLPLDTCLDWTLIGRLHCLLPWWEDATVDFMNSGGYNVTAQISQIQKRTLIIWGEEDQIIDSKLGVRLHCELPNAMIRQIPKCGHIPHVEKPEAATNLIKDFIHTNNNLPNQENSVLLLGQLE